MSTNSPLVPRLRTPHVITGMRGAADQAEAGSTFLAPILPEVASGQRVFLSRSRRLRLHLGKRPDKWDNADSGKKIPGFEFTALFDEYLIHIPAYFMKHAVPQEEQTEFLRRLENHPVRNIDFWDVSDLKTQQRADDEAVVEEVLARHPSLRKKLLADAAQAYGFNLEPKRAAPKKVEPAEPEPEEEPAVAQLAPPKPRRGKKQTF